MGTPSPTPDVREFPASSDNRFNGLENSLIIPKMNRPIDKMMDNPAFQNPPLAEVTFGLTFKPLERWRAGHFGLFWARLKDEYPDTQDQPPIGPPSGAAAHAWFPLPRAWFEHKHRQLLVQVQANGIWFNWRKLDAPEPYPRYAMLKPRYIELLNNFSAFVEASNLGPIEPITHELTYVNRIEDLQDNTMLSLLSRAFRHAQIVQPASETLAPVAIAEIKTLSYLEDVALTVSVAAGPISTDPRPPIRLDIRAASVKPDIPLSSLPAWLDSAHSAIVRTFTGLTTEELHRVWQRDI